MNCPSASSESLPTSTAPPASHGQLDDLLDRCRSLLGEISAFQEYLRELGRENSVELRAFRNSVGSELKAIKRLSNSNQSTANTIHALRSTNLPFLATVWTTAKSCTGLQAFSKRFYWDGPPSPQPGSRHPRRKAKKRSSLVDIVTKEGEEWVKVSTITGERLLFELAKENFWNSDSEASSGDEGSENGRKVTATGVEAWKPMKRLEDDSSDQEDGDCVELLRTARHLHTAAMATRVRYKHPHVRFVLPKVVEGHHSAVDSILTKMRATGAAVECGNDASKGAIPDDSLPLASIFSRLVPSPHPNLTATLNIDCTILLALISDLSHGPLSPAPSYHDAINRQIQAELSDRLLVSSLYPALRNRTLVCAPPAARRMREIINHMGTPSERARGELLLGEGDAAGKPSAELREGTARRSAYPVPSDLRLPVAVVAREVGAHELPAVAARLEPLLSEINRAVFFLGWARKWTTITSNRTVARLIADEVEKEGMGCVGPGVWVCSKARSLVGKEKSKGQLSK